MIDSRNVMETRQDTDTYHKRPFMRDCVFYDFGDTAPSAYGAFCAFLSCAIETAGCNPSCPDYKKRKGQQK